MLLLQYDLPNVPLGNNKYRNILLSETDKSMNNIDGFTYLFHTRHVDIRTMSKCEHNTYIIYFT